jgi:hypothetical protein
MVAVGQRADVLLLSAAPQLVLQGTVVNGTLVYFAA